MNKRVIIGLVILISISLLGVVGVQIFWIRNAISVKNDLFTRSVTEALNRAANRIELYDKMDIANKMFYGNSLDMNMMLQQSDKILKNVPAGASNITPQITIDILAPQHPNQNHLNEGHYPRRGYQGEGEQVIVPQGPLRHDRLTDRTMNQSLSHWPDTLSEEYNSLIQERLKEASEIANQMYAELLEQSTNRVIKPELVRAVLKQELSNHQIKTKYEFGVYRYDSLLTKSSKQFRSKDASTVSLFPNDMLSQGFKLAVSFPDHEQYILASIKGMLLLSLFFSFIILFTFSFSLYTVLKQKKISEMQSDFINNMTHEFKTPIATISVAADTIVNDRIVGNPEQIKFFAGMIKKENKRMNQQVEKILRIARFERKDFEFKFEDTDIHELITRSVQSFSLQVEQKGGSVAFELSAENSIITTDPTHFAGVINNLLDNANKYTKGKPEIQVKTYNKNDGICITVKDNGIGMNRSVQSKIFERFYRQTTGDVHNVKGFGLGLSYVKAVVTANHGTISVQSEVGKGSTFEVFVPYSQAH